MFNLPVLDFTISIVFVFFLFSLLAASLLELVNTVRKRRARLLKDAVDKVFNDPQNKNFAELLYSHPIIEATHKNSKTLPSYLSAENFTTALIDVIAEEARTIKIGMNANNTSQEVKTNSLPSADALDNFKAGLATLKESDLKRLLTSLSQFVENSEQLNRKLESWFNGYMDRVTGWFKSKSNKILFVLSAIVVIVFYVDFFHLAKEFWNNDDLRDQIVASAIETVENDTTPIDPTVYANIGGDQVTSLDSLKAEIKHKYETTQGVYDTIKDNNLPVGWHIAKTNWIACNGFWNALWMIIVNLVGLLISVLAISRGAPFWFDTLSKLVNLRNSGKKPVVATDPK